MWHLKNRVEITIGDIWDLYVISSKNKSSSKYLLIFGECQLCLAVIRCSCLKTSSLLWFNGYSAFLASPKPRRVLITNAVKLDAFILKRVFFHHCCNPRVILGMAHTVEMCFLAVPFFSVVVGILSLCACLTGWWMDEQTMVTQCPSISFPVVLHCT